MDAVLPLLRRSDDIKNGGRYVSNDMKMTVKHGKSEGKRGLSVKISEAVNVTSTLKRQSAENAAQF